MAYYKLVRHMKASVCNKYIDMLYDRKYNLITAGPAHRPVPDLEPAGICLSAKGERGGTHPLRGGVERMGQKLGLIDYSLPSMIPFVFCHPCPPEVFWCLAWIAFLLHAKTSLADMLDALSLKPIKHMRIL